MDKEAKLEEHQKYIKQNFFAIGSSHARSLSKLVYQNRITCIPGASLSGFYKNIKEDIKTQIKKYSKLIIIIGGNDLIDQQLQQIRTQLVQQFLADIQDLLNIRKNLQKKDDNLIFFLLPPRYPKNIELQKQIRKVNKKIVKVFVQARKNNIKVSWIDLHKLGWEQKNFRPDQTHFSWEGEKELTKKAILDTLLMER